MSLAEMIVAQPRGQRAPTGRAAVHADVAAVAERLDRSQVAARSPLTLPVLEDHDDRPRDLSETFEGRGVLLAFYLGGWSEPCTAALRQLEAARAELAGRGVDVVAVTADAVGRIGATRERNRLGFLAVHDHGARFAQSLGLAYRPSAKVRSDLRSVGVRLPDWTGGTGHALTLPSTLLLDADRTVRLFVPADPSGARSDVAEAVAATLAESALPTG